MSFGGYLRQLREEKALRQADLAEAIGVSTVYICDIEKDRRYPPEFEKLKNLIEKMNLSRNESTHLFDLAGDARNSMAPDILDYLNGNPAAVDAIRRIMVQQEAYNWNMIP